MARSKTTKSVPAFEAKTHFGQLLDEVDRKGIRFLVKRRGKPVAVILGVEEFEDILEIAGEEADKAFQASLQQAKKEYELGETISLAALQKIRRKSK